MHSSDTQSNQVIFQTKNIDKNIYIKEQKGFYQRIRRGLGWLLICLFIALPFIQYQGEQAILFDVEVQKLNLFSMVLYPQDLMIFALIFIFSAFGLFYVSTQYGRIWCGYACPQTIWTMMFIWVEHRVEGNRQKRMRLDKMPLSINKLFIKGAKHIVWLLIAIITATVFMSYFVPAREIYVQLVTFEMSELVFSWVAFFALCTYINAGWIREKMCEHMCPYSRFQSVMFNKETKLITYDAARGENRGPRKIKSEKHAELGDCVDCNLCVQVCPVGIDIREGLQYECISCGLCIDACDQTMEKFSYEKGLIRYDSEVKQRGSQKGKFAYIAFMMAVLITSIYWVNNRSFYEVSVIKDRNVLYRISNEGLVENTYQIKLFNKTKQQAEFKLKLAGLEGFILKQQQSIVVAPQESTLLNVDILAPKEHQKKYTAFDFVFEQVNDEIVVTKASTFHAI